MKVTNLHLDTHPDGTIVLGLLAGDHVPVALLLCEDAFDAQLVIQAITRGKIDKLDMSTIKWVSPRVGSLKDLTTVQTVAARRASEKAVRDNLISG